VLLSSNNAGCRFLVALEGFLPAEAAATSSQDDETLVSEAAPALPGRPFLVELLSQSRVNQCFSMNASDRAVRWFCCATALTRMQAAEKASMQLVNNWVRC